MGVKGACYGSLGLQYLRTRCLKAEIETFTNRYTYAENNPVTFADPSGHKIAFGAMLGNMFGGGRNTGRNGGIGGLIANTAQKIADKVASTTRAAQNTTRSAVNLATGNPAAAAKNQLDNVVAQATGGITGTLGGGNPSVNGLGGIAGFVESVAAQIEAVRCQAYEYCKDIVQEVISNGVLGLLYVYGVPGTMYNPLPMEEQIANAQYIYYYLRERGWSLEAICGLLGNMHIESHYNPGTWQYMNDANFGFGIVQWSDAESKFLNYLNDTQFGGKCKILELIEVVNEMATNSPQKLMELELTYFLQSCEEDQWAPTTKYNCPAEVSFGDYVANTGNYNAREMASIFQGTYEKSTEEDSYEKRENWAEGWYNHFTGVEDIRECYKKYDY